jgi:hypothetical protein
LNAHHSIGSVRVRKAFEEYVAIAKAAATDGTRDAPAEMLVYGALVMRDTDSAREILTRAAKYLEDGREMPHIFARYLGKALHSIAEGEDPAQALRLRANARKKTSTKALQDIYFAVWWHKLRGAKSEKEAIRRAATQLGIKAPAAEKRFKDAKPLYRNLEKIIAKMRAENLQMPSLGQALTGAAATDGMDLWVFQMVTLFGAPKKGRYPIFPKVIPRT